MNNNSNDDSLDHSGNNQQDRKYIMVVDDEVLIVKLLGDLLSMKGFAHETFTDPQKAWIEFEKNPEKYGMLITDETMPGISGLDLSGMILSKKPGFPIVLCTGFSEHVDNEIAMEQGISLFLEKPLELHTLLKWINENYAQ